MLRNEFNAFFTTFFGALFSHCQGRWGLKVRIVSYLLAAHRTTILSVLAFLCHFRWFISPLMVFSTCVACTMYE